MPPAFVNELAWTSASSVGRAVEIVSPVSAALDPSTTPEQSHQSWLAQKRAEGWIWGLVKDPTAKTHPCMVPYADLQPEQRAKDELFLAAVRATAAVLSQAA
jgi:hypothetical protein